MPSTGSNQRPHLYVLAQRGIPVGGVRAPLLDPSPAEQGTIRERLTELKLL